MLIPHICRRSGRIFLADFLADFVKSTCERGCLTSVALAATTGEAQKPTRPSLPKICVTGVLFLLHSHSHSLQRCHAQDKRPKNLPPTSAQTRNFSNARTRRHHLSYPSKFQLIAITTTSECSQSPGSEAPCDPTKAPLRFGDNYHAISPI